MGWHRGPGVGLDQQLGGASNREMGKGGGGGGATGQRRPEHLVPPEQVQAWETQNAASESKLQKSPTSELSAGGRGVQHLKCGCPFAQGTCGLLTVPKGHRGALLWAAGLSACCLNRHDQAHAA